MTPELVWIFSIFLAPCKAKAEFGQLAAPRAARTVVEGLIWPFSLAFGRTPPSVALERMTAGRLTQALVVTVAVVCTENPIRVYRAIESANLAQ